MQIRHYCCLAGWLLALACLAVGCGKRSPHLRLDGTVDLGDGVKMEFVLIQPGSFRMGSEDRDPKEYIDEKPPHDVRLTKPFYLGKYEVTQQQWRRVMKKNPSEFEGDDLPVENVSWDDAQTFLKKLRRKTGENFVLPTEAQWEYACRAGSTRRFSWGDREADAADYAWFADNSGRATHPVGEKKPNAWGLYDMNGNVWEWCADSYESYPGAEVTDPLNSSPGRLHVVRGGGCCNKIGGLRPSNRTSEYRGTRNFGFRCAVLLNARDR
jgi:formylglycine-generating enzyme required for sulfatase activity